ncbi:DUF1996 domain-containing protein [Nocardiopsis coralliicola]
MSAAAIATAGTALAAPAVAGPPGARLASAPLEPPGGEGSGHGEHGSSAGAGGPAESGDPGSSGHGGHGAPERGGGGGAPEPGDPPDPRFYTDIRDVPEAEAAPEPGALGGADGTAAVDCGRNAGGVRNAENVIVAPGVEHGAQHTHDYVGNRDVQRFTDDVGANNRILAEGSTTCENADRSVHYWPVLRDLSGTGADAGRSGGGADGNTGAILTPQEVRIEFRGNAAEDVVPMPRFLQVITGDAKAVTNGPENARAQWTCTASAGQDWTSRISSDRYPLCPGGSSVVRIMDFPSCWDGAATESEDNRSHVRFPDETGTCPDGTRPVPQLRQTLVYDVPAGRSYAVDGFPDQGRAPVTDHSDFINVMPPERMDTVVNCINAGREC